ncbi:uncharacterized protein EI97DRAFT_456051 [Westerdykella ornata]|uniref:Uncharacterized protein n=1 Tax=Westerdykella ornata TaxID=318751 RepID=A0A6A6JQR7_WESOR|nr:uncharacterized protein EI97DRAFT_456051 [Westerdykella ornata]KAF2278584.1 hypothetical protein EI97DRAFT_456051 [Westerdykella ornata]
MSQVDGELLDAMRRAETAEAVAEELQEENQRLGRENLSLRAKVSRLDLQHASHWKDLEDKDFQYRDTAARLDAAQCSLVVSEGQRKSVERERQEAQERLWEAERKNRELERDVDKLSGFLDRLDISMDRMNDDM